MVGHLNRLNYPKVINRNVDFYSAIEGNAVPSHDFLISNPPYSGSHPERLLTFASSENSGTPFALLLPGYIYNKPYFASSTAGANVFFLIPRNRIYYDIPVRLRVKGGKESTAPFHSFWFVGNLSPADRDRILAAAADELVSKNVVIATSIAAIPNEFRDVTDGAKKRLSSKRRNKLREKKNGGNWGQTRKPSPNDAQPPKKKKKRY